MSEPLDLDAIEARANAATPSPWQTGGDLQGVWRKVAIQRGLILQSAIAQSMSRMFIKDYCESLTMWDAWEDEAKGREDRNAEFIAHARDDVPALIAEVRRLRALLEQR